MKVDILLELMCATYFCSGAFECVSHAELCAPLYSAALFTRSSCSDNIDACGIHIFL